MPKRITTTEQSKTGRNLKFHDNFKNKNMTDKQFIEAIKKGKYPRYTVKKIHGKKTAVSKPDKSVNNNLG